MDSVWLLWFEQEHEDGSETELLVGVYRREDGARAAIERLKEQPGFCDYPQGFNVYERTLDEDSWQEGFEEL